MKPNCICSFSGSDKAPSELLHFYVGVDCVWKLFLGPFFPLFFFFLSFKPPQICNAASFISKLLSPPPQILLPLLVPLLQGGAPLRTRGSLPRGPFCIPWFPAQRGPGCPLRACWHPPAAGWLPAALNAGLLPGQQSLLVAVWQLLPRVACGAREHKPQ